MNIIHVSDVFIRHGGGAPNVIKELAKYQIAQGNRVKILTFRHQTDWPFEEEIEGIAVHRADLKDTRLPFYVSGYRNMRNLAKETLVEFEPDILHLHMPFSGLAVLDANSSLFRVGGGGEKQIGRGPKVVYTFHGSWAEESAIEASGFKRISGLYLLEKLLMKQIEERALFQADTVVTLSQFMQNEARKYRIKPRSGWKIVPAGVDLTKFKVKSLPPVAATTVEAKEGEKLKVKFRKSLGMSENAFLLLCVRRLARRMGLEELIDAVEIVRKHIPNVFLIIGGKGELHGSLELKVSGLKLQKNIRLEGFIPEEKYADYCAAADLFILPTQSLEGFGLVILESLACGTPVLGTPVGAIPEVIGPFNKDLLTQSPSATDIADGIIDYRRNYFRQDTKIRTLARAYAEKFSWEKMNRKYLEIYQSH
ncbi:glycosyltransferase family 4 protein [Patescibacteria group bacterium]|nr:glycosyltransferase family 4 protein [Patescibacteria group bacterium]